MNFLKIKRAYRCGKPFVYVKTTASPFTGKSRESHGDDGVCFAYYFDAAKIEK